MIAFIINFLLFFLLCTPAYAIGSLVAGAIFGGTMAGWAVAAIGFAINMVVSSVVSKLFAPSMPGQDNLNAQLPNPGNRQQLPPAGDNKLPVVYGSAYVGGIITDLSISEDNQDIYWVMSLSEVTNTETSGTPDLITFGDVYWGGKKCIFSSVTTQNTKGGIMVLPIPFSTNAAWFILSIPLVKIGDKVRFGTDAGPTSSVFTVAAVSISTLGDVPGAAKSVVIRFEENLYGVPFPSVFFIDYQQQADVSVTGLLDESTGVIENVTGYMDIYLYNNGSNSPANTTQSAITVMQNTNLIYKWDNTKLMSNTAFAIIHIKYNQDKNLTGLNQTRFQVNNLRQLPGDCLLDYLTSTRYGAAIPVANIDQDSLDELNNYSSEIFTYTTYEDEEVTQSRFVFNGTIDTKLKIMQNIQSMSDCCDCLIKYNEIIGKWGVIVQKPTYTVAMDINNTNTIGAITVTPIDLNNSFNIIECKYPDGSAKDSFNSVTFDLATINPSLLFANEPVNKQSVNLYLVNDNVRVQYLANRMLEVAREDLQIQANINYVGLQLEAGDVVTVTNANYGWAAKLFRINKVIEKFGDDGSVTASLNLMEYNPAIYDDINITQFAPSPNSGLGTPTAFGTTPAPVISAYYPSAAVPNILVTPTSSSAGITQYAEIWYSAYSAPSETQKIFFGITATQPSGLAYTINQVLPSVNVTGLPAGNWYFFSRMVNKFAKSDFSPASTVLAWRPTTFQYSLDYITVAYADDVNGGGFSLSPRNKTYYGLCNQNSITPTTNPADYQWYLASPSFGSDVYVCYTNRQNYNFSFDTDMAQYASGTGAFVPTTSSEFDPKLWSAIPDETNYIDLRLSTGQFIGVGNTTTGTGQVKIVNTSDGQVVAALDTFLDFGGAQTKTGSATNITIDIYGRVVGFSTPDLFYITISDVIATSGQTIFSETRDADYIIGQCLVFQNGCLLDESEYTDASGSVTLNIGATLNDIITIISMRSESTGVYYASTSLIVESVVGAVVTWDLSTMPKQLINAGDIMTFDNVGTPTQYTVSSVDYTNREITFTGSVTASANATIYSYRAANSSYQVFSRFTADLTSASIYTPTEWQFNSGFELPFMNGTVVPDKDYDISGNSYTNMPALTTGKLTIIQFNQNNLTAVVGTPVNIITNTVIGQTTYSFNFTPYTLNLYANGLLFIENLDYNTGTNSYTLANTPIDNITVLQQQSFSRDGAA
jgi:hypothetical protein